MRIKLCVVLAMLLTCGCAGTRYANSANSHEIDKANTAYAGLRDDIASVLGENVSFDDTNFKEIGNRIERMARLQEARNQNEGMANVPPSDDLLPIAIEKLNAQGANWRTIYGIANAAGSSIFGGYWREMLAALAAVGITAVSEYKRRKAKGLAIANTQAIEAYGIESPADADRLKDLQRYYLAKNSGHDALVQAAVAIVRANAAETQDAETTDKS